MRSSHGLTLVEIMIAMSVSAIALAGAIVASNTQQLAYSSGNRVRAAQNSARSALLSIEQKVALAGYGMDAPLALDFGWYTPPAALCPSAVVTTCARDKTSDSDELVFYGRNPSYWVDPAAPDVSQPRGHAWWISAFDSGSVTITANAGDVFRRGQICRRSAPGRSVTPTSRSQPRRRPRRARGRSRRSRCRSSPSPRRIPSTGRTSSPTCPAPIPLASAC